jgi:sulfur carrier protein ThiS
VRVHLGGHLNWYDAQHRAWIELPANGTRRLVDICAALGVPPEEIAVAVVNGQSVELENATAASGDRVEFYPPIGGGMH